MMSSPVTEWEVWLADGRRLTSLDCTWADVPDGILVVRWWGPKGKGINWGDGLYGLPSTLKNAGIVTDAEFARILAEAQLQVKPPSGRF